MSPQLLTPPMTQAAGEPRGDARMSRRLVYPFPLPSSELIGISIPGGGHEGARLSGVRQCRSSKFPSAPPLASGERSRPRWWCGKGDGESRAAASAADGITATIDRTCGHGGWWVDKNRIKQLES